MYSNNKITDGIGLQVDNLVYNKKGEFHRISPTDLNVFRHPQMNSDYGFYGIELSLDIIIELGFKKKSFYNAYILEIDDKLSFEFYYSNNLPHIFNLKVTNENYDENIDLGSFITYKELDIQYLHELQNLYYILTKKELKVMI